MSLNQALQAIKNEAYSSNKVQVAKQFISGGWMTSNEVLEVVRCLVHSGD